MISRLYISPILVNQYYSTQLVPEDSKLQNDITDVDTFSSVHPHRQQLTFLVLPKGRKGEPDIGYSYYVLKASKRGLSTIPEQASLPGSSMRNRRHGELQNKLQNTSVLHFFDNNGCTFLEPTQYNNSFLPANCNAFLNT